MELLETDPKVKNGTTFLRAGGIYGLAKNYASQHKVQGPPYPQSLKMQRNTSPHPAIAAASGPIPTGSAIGLQALILPETNAKI